MAVLALALGAQAGAAWLWMHLWGTAPVDLTLLAGVANLTALTAVGALGFWRSGEPPGFHLPRGTGFPFWVGLGLSAVGATVVLGQLTNLTALIVPLPPELARQPQGLLGWDRHKPDENRQQAAQDGENQ